MSNERSVFLKILHDIVSHPLVYDSVQILAGVRFVHNRLYKQIEHLNLKNKSIVFDIGGGTGISKDLWPDSSQYICLDNDIVKLKGYLNKYPSGVVLLGDATQIPARTNSADVVLCTLMSHHIPIDLLLKLFQESVRILKPEGRIFFIDAVWNPKRLAGRLLWSLDRGSYPHSAETLYKFISNHCQVIHWERFAIYHEYVLGIATK